MTPPPESGPGRVLRDSWGVPHVVAGSVSEVVAAQGRATALDRTWQVEHGRAKAEGRLAALVGRSGLPWDRFARRFGVEPLARRAYAALAERDPRSAALLVSYVDGLNEGLSQQRGCTELAELGVEPVRWSPWTPMAVFAAHHVLFAGFPAKLWRRHLRRVVGEEVAPVFHDEGAWSPGSNSWVVGAERSASGRPLLGGDPHRTFESPNPYQQVRLTCTDPEDPFDVAGFTFPGVPGVQHFAHAGAVAWGITNAMADYQDLFEERLERRGDQVWAEGPGGWERAATHRERIEVRDAEAEDCEVIVTANGPVVVGGVGQEPLSLRTASYALDDLGFGCLLPLLRARTSADVLAALDGWVEPVNNLVVADVHGAVRQQVVGRVPVRPEENRWRPVPGWLAAHRWSGWVDPLPGRDVAADEHLVTANQRMDGFDPIGVEFAPPGRADRIDALLAGRGGLTRDDFAEVHRDDLAGQPAALARAVVALDGLTPAGSALRDRLAGWDQHFAAGSTDAAAYVAVRERLVERLATSPRFAALDVPGPHGSLFASWFDLRTQLYLSLPTLLSPPGRAAVPEAVRLLAEAVEEVAAEPDPGPWGTRHRFRPWHALGHELPVEPALAGDNDCVHCTGALPGSEAVVRGSVARYVWDLGGLDRSGWVVPLGTHGDPAHRHHHDQLDLWVSGVLIGL